MVARKALVVVSMAPALLPLSLIECTSAGTTASISEAGSDGTVTGDAPASTDAELDAGDEGEAADGAFVPCYPVVPAQPYPSDDCVYVGPCLEDCLMNTASAYACFVPSGTPGAGGDASPLYPSVFTAPIGVVNVVAITSGQYPWAGNAYVACAPLSCVRWSTGDHVDGGSAWPGDPCGGEAGAAVQAWSCPGSPGVVPPGPGCINAGALDTIGGPETGVPLQNVWCCPPPPDAGASEDAEPDDGASEGSAPSDAGDSGNAVDGGSD
jgi:hypothetical protein